MKLRDYDILNSDKDFADAAFLLLTILAFSLPILALLPDVPPDAETKAETAEAQKLWNTLKDK